MIAALIVSPAPAEEIFFVPHFHWDLAWLKTEPEYAFEGAKILKTYIDEAEEDPRFRFVVDQAPLLEALCHYYPDYESRLQSLLDTNHLEIPGAFFVQPDEHLASGESLCRQLILGQEYLEGKWGRRSHGCWNIDSFGHTLQLPQICLEGDVRFFAMSRQGDRAPSHERTEFEWEGPDGSRLLTHYMRGHNPDFDGYILAEDVGNVPQDNPDIQDVLDTLRNYDAAGFLLAPNGHDFRAAAEFVPEAVGYWNSTHSDKASISTPSEFFQAVRDSHLPLEILSNVEFTRRFAGSYSSHIHLKQKNAELENLLLSAEKWAAAASVYGFSYPSETFEHGTLNLALNQDHDYITGCSVDAAYDIPQKRYQETESMLRDALTSSTAFIAGKVNTRDAPSSATRAFVVFNPLCREREDIVTLTLSFSQPPPDEFQITDPGGKEIPCQILSSSGDSLELAFPGKIPSLGYQTFFFIPGRKPSLSPQEKAIQVTTETLVVTDQLILRADHKGHLPSLKDLEAGGREVFRTMNLDLEHEAWVFPHRHYEGRDDMRRVRLSHLPVSLNTSRTLVSIVLPQNQRIYIAGITLESASGQTKLDLTPYFNTDGVSFDSYRLDGDLDGKYGCYPGELFPPSPFSCHCSCGIEWIHGSTVNGAEQFIRCSNQVVSVPEGKYTRLHLLCMSVNCATTPGTLIFRYSSDYEEQTRTRVTDWAQPIPGYNPNLAANEISWEDEKDGDAYWYGSGGASGSTRNHDCITTRIEGPVMTRLVTEGLFVEDSPLRREVRIYKSMKRIDFRTSLDWKGLHKNVYLNFPMAPSTGKRTEGVPYGFVERPDGRYPVQKWSDWGGINGGAAVLNLGLTDHFSEPGNLKLTLLRSMDVATFRHYGHPSQLMKGQWKHHYDYALYAHGGDWVMGEVPFQAWAFTNPLLSVETSLDEGSLPLNRSYARLGDGDQCIVTVMRRCGDSMEMRLYEPHGRPEDISLDIFLPGAGQVDRTNLLEDLETLEGHAPHVDLSLVPSDIATLRIGLGNRVSTGWYYY